MHNIHIQDLQLGNFRQIAKAITYVENDAAGGLDILQQLTPNANTMCIGITGAPGAGKSTLVNALLQQLTASNKKVAVISVDPSSPFNYGALLGDRIRMADFYLNPNVYIRSLASRGALGGLHPRIIEIIELLKCNVFDYIIIETVGVGQSEVDVAGIADTTVVVVVPEGGDEVQTLKAGVMEIADVFVVNKADRSLASTFATNLKTLSHSKATATWETPVIKTIATTHTGITDLLDAINKHHLLNNTNNQRRVLFTARKIYNIISQQRMVNLSMQSLLAQVQQCFTNGEFTVAQILKVVNVN